MDGLFVNLRECENDRWKATTTSSAIGQYQFTGVEEGEYYIDFFKPNPVDRYEFTLPQVAGADDDVALDSDVVILDGTQGKSNCMVVTEGFNKLINAGYLMEDTKAPIAPTVSPVTKAPSVPRYCAFVDEETNNFEFLGCSKPCTFSHDDCPDGMLCALTNAC